MPNVINVAEDFSPYPGGRYPKDGEGNGTEFREKFLKPALASDGQVIVNLDGAAGYPSSFLDEAFAGLVRLKSATPNEVLSKFKIVSSEPGLARVGEMIAKYVHAATPQS